MEPFLSERKFTAIALVVISLQILKFLHHGPGDTPHFHFEKAQAKERGNEENKSV
jgi:hypothetical protein